MDKVRNAAYKILLEIIQDGGYSNLELNSYFNNQEVESEAVVRRLVYGVLEKQIYLDYYLDKLLAKGLAKTKASLATILRLGAYQLEFMDSIPDYAAIDTSVELAKEYTRGMDKLVNGVLRSWQREKESIPAPDINDSVNYLSVSKSVHPEIAKLMIQDYGPEKAESILGQEHNENIVRVRVNLAVSSVARIMKELDELGISYEVSDISPRVLLISNKGVRITELDMYKRGHISIQSEGSCWIADLVDAKAGERILDVCSAPGGKTLAMAESAGYKAEITACDIYEHRLNLVRENAERIGALNINTVELDATEIFPDIIPFESYDKVLVDAPCSGLGVMNAKPDIRLREPNTKELARIQHSILVNSSTRVKPGGKLIYSTCTLLNGENHEVVKKFLKGDTYFSLDKEEILLPDENKCHDGFYCAVISRKGDHTQWR